MRRRLLCLAGVALLAGCGATSTSTTTASSSPTSTSTSTSTSASSTTTGPAGATSQSSSAPRASAAGAGCSASQIAVSAGPAGAGASHVGAILRFRNTSSRRCILSGYPGAALSTAAGHEVQARRTPSGYLGGVTGSSHAPLLSVSPGATVSALLEGLDADVARGGGPCPTYAHLLVTPPNQRVTVRMATPLAQVCAPEIHPVVAGMSGRTGG